MFEENVTRLISKSSNIHYTKNKFSIKDLFNIY